MSKIKLRMTFLGTGTSQGIPVIGSDHPVCLSDDPKDRRLRVSVLLEVGAQHWVIDVGPDFRQQMLRQRVQKLDAILFTHEHADHTAGVDDLRPFYFRQGDLPCYVSPRVAQALKDRFSYMFVAKNKYPGVATLLLHEFEDVPFYINGVEVIPIKADHGYLPVHGFRTGNLAYLTDVKRIDRTELDKLKGLDIFVINVLRHEEHPTHLNLQEALDIIDYIKPKRTYFTHISHVLGFHEEVQKSLPDNVFLAYDNLTVTTD